MITYTTLLPYLQALLVTVISFFWFKSSRTYMYANSLYSLPKFKQEGKK
uniref:Uncharacterized protein n=1 Tax=Arundo donax TaxID=35708 RepID=A0A0A9CLC7_ARUDO